MVISGTKPAGGIPDKNPSMDIQSIEQKIQKLQQQLKKIKEDDKLPPEEKQKRIERLQEKIERLEEQKRKMEQKEQQKGASSEDTEERKASRLMPDAAGNYIDEYA